MSNVVDLLDEKAAIERANTQSNPRHNEVIRQADLWIGERLGEWKNTKKWKWDLAQRLGCGGYDYLLTMSYRDEKRNKLFTEHEMQEEYAFKHSIFLLWNLLVDALMERNGTYIQQLLKDIREEHLAG